MKIFSAVLPAFLACAVYVDSATAAETPEGYKLLYERDFEDNRGLEDFEMSDPAAWRVGEDNGNNHALELFDKSDYSPRVRSPYNIALITNGMVGDFILEADLRQTGREYGHRDMCIFFGAKDPSNFYYVHIATAADDHAHNVFIVNDEPRVKTTDDVTEGVDWGENEWHKLRLERKLSDGSIKVFFDDMEKPIMTATDGHFDFGYIGFGSFDDTGMVDNIRIWGPGFAPEKSGFFR
ncbi:MAG: hypothetical protein K9N48_06980 [Verrucomicrobia bacterium]|nr:hypothetical protein [Verrucomicrobiota bacterium]MCF7707560.1 hypothetical protein [Verrucomicrobiota bacterium]